MNRNRSLGWPWTLTNIYGKYCRLWPHEVARAWGEATWTARDLWEVRQCSQTNVSLIKRGEAWRGTT